MSSTAPAAAAARGCSGALLRVHVLVTAMRIIIGKTILK